MVSQTIGVTLAKITIAVTPVFAYILIRQLCMSTFFLVQNKSVVPEFVEQFKSSTFNVKLQTIGFGTLRSMNVISAYYVFDKIDLSLFSSLETPITVLFSVLLGIIILKERPSLKFYMSVVIVLMGVILITGFNTTGLTLPLLVLLMLNGISLALTGIFTQNISASLSNTSISLVGITGTVPAIFIASIIQLQYIGFDWLSDVSPYIIITFVLATSCTFISNITAVQAQIVIGATRFQVVKTFSIVLALIPATLVLGDTVSLVQLVGISLSIIGVILVTLSPKSQHK